MATLSSKNRGYYTTPCWKKTALGTPIDLFSSTKLETFSQEPRVRPVILLGGVHGDEPEGVHLASETLNWLKRATEAGEELVPWIVVPCLNVDGLKNQTRVNGRGVDLNRNYPSSDWSPNAEKERYFPGAFPASEPEIQAVVELIKSTSPRLLIHCHSWKPCIVGTGSASLVDAERLARSSGYPAVEDIGYPTPGSLSQYGWNDNAIPVICIEEQDGLSDLATIWPRFENGMKEIFTDTSLRSRPGLEFSQLVFDLDDTLVDTSKLLIPQASRESCRAMIEAGLNCSEDDCVRERTTFTKKNPRHYVYKHLVETFGIKTNSQARLPLDENTGKIEHSRLALAVQDAGYQAFHNRKVEPGIDVFTGVRELLAELRTRYQIHLVTSGNRKTQEQKVNILNLSESFDGIHHVDPLLGQTKQQAFIEIMTRTNTRPQRCLSIGNRLDNEICEAKEIGWKTCWVQHGEYCLMKPRNIYEEPDFTIKTIGELKARCRL